jgi:hypothetical protein
MASLWLLGSSPSLSHGKILTARTGTPHAITYHTPENVSEEDTNLQPDLEIDVSEEHRKAKDYIQTTVFDEASVPSSSGSTDAHQSSSTAELFSHLPTLEQDETVAQSFIGASDAQSDDFPGESARVSVMGDGVDQEPGPAPRYCGTEYLVDIDTRGWTPSSDGLDGLSEYHTIYWVPAWKANTNF